MFPPTLNHGVMFPDQQTKLILFFPLTLISGQEHHFLIKYQTSAITFKAQSCAKTGEGLDCPLFKEV